MCVTGLTSVDTSLYSGFGRTVVLLLIQFGGLGLITFMTIFLANPRGRISFASRKLIGDYYVGSVEVNPRKIIRSVVVFTLAIELAGALCMLPVFRRTVGGRAGFYAHLPRGLRVLQRGILPLSRQPRTVRREPADQLHDHGSHRVRGHRLRGHRGRRGAARRATPPRLTLHTRLVLAVTGVLIVGGAAVYLAFEAGNAYRGMGPLQKLMAALFQSITPRTAGFDTVNQATLTEPSKFFTMFLMYVGASPASTGGGIKTTTFFIVLAMILRGTGAHEDVHAFGRRVSSDSIARGMMYALRAFAVLALAIFVLTVSELLVRPSMDKQFLTGRLRGVLGVRHRGALPRTHPFPDRGREAHHHPHHVRGQGRHGRAGGLPAPPAARAGGRRARGGGPRRLMKQFAIIGLGKFGRRMIDELAEAGCELLVIDRDRGGGRRVQGPGRGVLRGRRDQRGGRHAPRAPGIDAAILDLGDNIEAAILATKYLKQLGVARIVAKVESDQHAEILELVGATDIIRANLEAARRVAPLLLSSMLFSYLPIGKDFVIAELKVPAEFVGRSLIEANLRQAYRLNVIALKVAPGTEYTYFDPDYRLQADDAMLVAAKEEDLESFAREARSARRGSPGCSAASSRGSGPDLKPASALRGYPARGRRRRPAARTMTSGRSHERAMSPGRVAAMSRRNRPSVAPSTMRSAPAASRRMTARGSSATSTLPLNRSQDIDDSRHTFVTSAATSSGWLRPLCTCSAVTIPFFGSASMPAISSARSLFGPPATGTSTFRNGARLPGPDHRDIAGRPLEDLVECSAEEAPGLRARGPATRGG